MLSDRSPRNVTYGFVGSENLSDKAYHQLLETLFRVTTVEVSAYIKASKASQKKSAESQLSKCAEILRRVVQLGTRKFRLNTVKALLDHITQTLPTSDESYCEPLTVDYLRSLKLLLSYPPHAEHLSKDEWCEVVEFCVQATKDVSYILNDWDLSESNGFSTVAPTTSRLSFRELSTVEFDRQSHDVSYGSSSRSRNNVYLKGSAEDIVLSLQYLISVPHSPISEKAQAILKCLLELLRFVSLSDHVQYAAFQAINAILPRILTDDTTLVLQVMPELIPLIRRCWLSTKSSILKEVMLVGLLFGEAYFPRVSSIIDGRTLLSDLVETLQDEYCRRHARDQLQVDDLDLSMGSYPDARSMPFQTSCFRLRLGLLKAEPCWALLSVSAAMTVEISNSVSSGTNEGNAYSGPRIKRRKMSPFLDTLMQSIGATAKAQKLYALQIFCFVFDMLSFDPISLQEQVEGISSVLADDDNTLASWTMLAMTWYVSEIVRNNS